MIKSYLPHGLIGLIVTLALAACSSTAIPTPDSPTATFIAPSPTPRATQTTLPAPTAIAEPSNTGWLPLTAGIEWSQRSVETKEGRERLTLVRVDPSQVRFRVLYEPTHPRSVHDWAADLPGALLVVNAGYFTPENQTTGLLISDGFKYGVSYDDFAGQFTVLPDGRAEVRWLRAIPYRESEPLAQAVQCFPVIVKPGGQMGFPPDADQGQTARRTIVAQDFAGRILFIISPRAYYSLHEMAVYLTESAADLEIDVAMNLDGGFSTGLWLAGQDLDQDSFVQVPAVIAIEPQE